MRNNLKGRFYGCLSLLLSVLLCSNLKAQTDLDGLMMPKNNFCGGPMYGYSSWTNYWEGSFKRDNDNLGKVSTQMYTLMGIYGVTNKFNLFFSLPYIRTNASQGTLHGMNGFQDLSIWAKWKPVKTAVGGGTFSLFGLAGFSVPTSNYVPDFLPLSIGLHSKTFSGRLIADYQLGKFFATTSGTYTYRSNVNIDRTSYYTTTMHLTNNVEMPDVASFNFRAGFRSSRIIAEAILANSTTLGGFDIRKNDMPFPSNKMNMTSAGVNFKYELQAIKGLSFTGGGNYVVAGRNVGQATSVNGGILYIIDFSTREKNKSSKTN